MEYAPTLLKAKLARLARNRDEASLAFVTTLLTCGGEVSYEYGYPRGFYDYRTLWGEVRFEEERKRLQEEGVILENDQRLYLNCPGWGSMSFEEREEVSRDLSASLFPEALDFYRDTISRTTSVPEGRYILSELLKAGHTFSEDTCSHLMRVAGPKYFQEVKNILSGAGLFVHAGSSRKHDYYRMFSPIVDLPSTANDALAFVYIAQFVRADGPGRAGVLDSDCRQFEREIMHLVLQGAIKGASWVSLRGYATTPEGDVRASAIVQERLNASEDALRQLLDRMPDNFLRFFYEEVLGPEYIGDAWVISRSAGTGFRDNLLAQEDCSHLCLLNDARVKEMRDEVMDAISRFGLAMKARSYVSSKGGRVDDLTYVPASEVRGQFRQYMETRGLLYSESLFTGDLELAHKLYHVLSGPAPDILPIAGEKARALEYAEDQGIRGDYLEKVLREFVSNGLIREEGDGWVIPQHQPYQKALMEGFYLPLVKHVLEESTTGVYPVPEPSRPSPPPEPPEGTNEGIQLITPEPPLSGTVVLLGNTPDGRSYHWRPLEEPNPHILIVGSPGVGKSQTAKAVAFQLRKTQIPAFIIDFENEYGDELLASLVLKPGQDVTVNPLDLLEGDPRTVKFQISGILKKIYNLGDQQEALVRRAIEQTYRSAGIDEGDRSSWATPVPSFQKVRDGLEALAQGRGQDANRARATLNRLEPLFELEVFSGETQIAFDTILSQGAVVFLRDLPTEETKMAAAEFFLRWLWQRILNAGEVQGILRLTVILDEAHKLAYENSPVADLLRRGRKYGVSCLLATQQPDDFESRELAFQNTAVHVAFWCNSERHARTMAREMLGGEDLYREIRSLKRFEAVIMSHDVGSTNRITVTPYFSLAS